MAKAQGQRRKATKGDLKVSTFINMTLRDAMERKARSSYNLCKKLVALRRRLKSLEEDIHELRQVRSLAAGKLGKEEPVDEAEGRLRRAYTRKERVGKEHRGDLR